MKVALVHDWLLSSIGGAENVLEEIHGMFSGPIYTLFAKDPGLEGSYFEDKEIHTSWLQRLPGILQRHTWFLPLFPGAVESWDLGQYDLLLSSSHCVAKGVLTHPEQLHICYCHTPMRYAWDLLHVYLRDARLDRGLRKWIASRMLASLRTWDVIAANRVDHFLANSSCVARRIEKYYGRTATVIHPSVDTDYFTLEEEKEGYYVTAGRLVAYKRVDLIVEAFTLMPEKKLIVIGDGPERKKIAAKAGKNVVFLGSQPREALRQYIQKAKGFLFAALEDFGIAPVEAMSTGTPVIAFGKGGALDTVLPGKTGIFFPQQTSLSIMEAVQIFERMSFSPGVCRNQAVLFSKERFRQELRSFVEQSWEAFSRKSREATPQYKAMTGMKRIAPSDKAMIR